MDQYAKSLVNNVITVTSIATALRADLRNRIARTESHNFPEIFYMAEGTGYTVINGKRHFLKAGQMIIYAANSVHGQGTGGIAEIISFEVMPHFPQEYCDKVITLTGSQRLILHQIIEKAGSMVEKRIGIKGMIMKKHVDPHDVQNIKNRLELFLLDIIRPVENYKHDKVNAVTDYLMQNMHRMLTLEEMSNELGISITSLKRLVQNTYSKAPAAYFTDLKIQEAKRLLQYSPLTVSEIAEQLGFSSVHYFSRVFKNKTNATPSNYRKDFQSPI